MLNVDVQRSFSKPTNRLKIYDISRHSIGKILLPFDCRNLVTIRCLAKATLCFPHAGEMRDRLGG